MELPVYRNNHEKGFTLIEVMVAMFILLFGMLALWNTAAVVIDHNLLNVLRDEATSVAGDSMVNFKNAPFSSLNPNNLNPATYGSTPGSAPPTTVTRVFKGFTVNYTVTTSITPQGGQNTQRIDVAVQWKYKGTTYNRNISTVVNNAL